MNRALGVALVATALASAQTSRAEPAVALVREDGSSAVGERLAYASTGLDGALVLTVGGAAGVAAAGPRLALGVSGDVTWAFGAFDAGDVRLRGGVGADVVRAGPFRVRVGLSPSLRNASTEMFTARAVATELRVAPGVALGRWTFELDGSVEQTWLAYIAPTDRYRREVYAGAVSGWYGLSARTFRVGGAASVRLAAFELYAGGGWERRASLDVLPPAYLALGAARRF